MRETFLERRESIRQPAYREHGLGVIDLPMQLIVGHSRGNVGSDPAQQLQRIVVVLRDVAGLSERGCAWRDVARHAWLSRALGMDPAGQGCDHSGVDSIEATDPFTLINVFRVDPADQAALAARVALTAREVAAALPGFLDATVLVSDDGQRVVNYAHWRDREAFQRFLAAAKDERSLAAALGEPDGHSYTIASRVVASEKSPARGTRWERFSLTATR